MTNSSLKIKNWEDLSEALDSIYKTQSLIIQKLNNIEHKLNQLSDKLTKINSDLDKLSNQLDKLSLGSSKQPPNKFILAKPRVK